MNNTTILPDGSACFTATIMSEDEALALPVEKRPICYRISSEMYHDVFESIGAASMTFNKDAGNEVFNSELASKIAVELCFKIAEEKERAARDARQSAFKETAEIVDREHLFEHLDDPSDKSYDQAVNDCHKAILAYAAKEASK